VHIICYVVYKTRRGKHIGLSRVSRMIEMFTARCVRLRYTSPWRDVSTDRRRDQSANSGATALFTRTSPAYQGEPAYELGLACRTWFQIQIWPWHLSQSPRGHRPVATSTSCYFCEWP